MLWLLFSLSALAQDDIDLSAIKKLDEELPIVQHTESDITQRFENRRYRPPYRAIRIKEILASGTEYGSIQQGRKLIRISDGKAFEVSEDFFGKFYRLQDEQGFKYLQNNDGSCVYKINTRHVESIQKELALYEPPLRYTPAPTNIVKAEYDQKLKLLPEVSFYVGPVQGAYMKDLFNDNKASSGVSTQYGVHLATDWELPIKVGGVLHYEKSTFDLTGGGKINYSSFSFGPQFKSKDFDWAGYAIRFQTQFRVSPFARLDAETIYGNASFKFNSADVMLSAEHPVKNSWGEFVLGVFFQNQWLNIKDQPETVSIEASNATNKSFGLSFSQVFQ